MSSKVKMRTYEVEYAGLTMYLTAPSLFAARLMAAKQLHIKSSQAKQDKMHVHSVIGTGCQLELEFSS